MRNLYHFRLSVECPDGKRYAQAFTVNADDAPQFEPYDLCDSALTAMAVSGVLPDRASRIDTDRESLLREIATVTTEALLDQIKARDLRNGYPQPQNPAKP